MVSTVWVEVTAKGGASFGQITKGVDVEAMVAWGDAPDFTLDGRLRTLTGVGKVDDTTNVGLLIGVFELALSVDGLSWRTVGVASLLNFVAVVANLGLVSVAHGPD